MNRFLNYIICVFLILCIELDFVIMKHNFVTCIFFLYLRWLIVYTSVALEICNFMDAYTFLEINSPKPYIDPSKED